MASPPSTPPGEGFLQNLRLLDVNALTARLETLIVAEVTETDLISPVENLETGGVTAQPLTLETNSIAQFGYGPIDGAVSSPDSFVRSDDSAVASSSLPGSAGSITSIEQEDSTITSLNQQQFANTVTALSPARETMFVSPYQQPSVTSVNEDGTVPSTEQQQAESSGSGAATINPVTLASDGAAPLPSGPSPNNDDSGIHPAFRSSGRIYGMSANDRFPTFAYQTDGTARMVANPLAQPDPEGLESGDFLNVSGPSQSTARPQASGSNTVTMPGNITVETMVADGLITSRVLTSRGWALSVSPTSEVVLTQTPAPMSRNTSGDGQGLAAGNNDSDEPPQRDDRRMLLGLCDCLRQVLRLSEIPHTLLTKLTELLDIFLEDEEDDRALTVEMLIHTRLDKLFADLLLLAGRSETIDPLFQEILQKVTALEYRLQRRLGQSYLELDRKRASILKRGEGLLYNVVLNTTEQHNNSIWLIRDPEPIATQAGHLKFTPGDWWLNIESAFRDGIVGSPDEKLTNGDYGACPRGRLVTALSLLTGIEVKGDRPNTVKYIRVGAASDIHLRLMTQFGREIRVVRGYQLISPYAPKGGVRYDGLYYIRNYSHKYDDGEGGVPGSYRSEITLERLPNQASIDEYAFLIPTPAQLDDWKLYNKILGRHIRTRFGETHWHAWFIREEMGEMERESARVHRDTQQRYAQFRNMARGPST